MSQTADRTLAILDLVASSDTPLSLMEITGATSLDKSVVSRILASLLSSGFLERSATDKRYGPGARFVALSLSAIRRSGLAGPVGNVVRELAQSTGETVSVHLRTGRYRVCIDGVESQHAVRRGLVLGGVVPLPAGPTGKVITAFLEPRELADVWAAVQEADVDMQRLTGMLDSVRRRGYLIGVGDRTAGVGAISAPLFDANGVVASITVAGPSERWSLGRMERFAPILLDAARGISDDLGGRFPDLAPAPVAAMRGAS